MAGRPRDMNPLEVPASTYQRVNRGMESSFPRAHQRFCAVTGPCPYVNLTCHSRALALVCDVEEPLKVVAVEMVAVAAAATAASLRHSHPL